MGVVRVTLKSVGYPKTIENSVLVLQELQNAGFKVYLKNVKYADREVLKEYFFDRNIIIHFGHVKADIDVCTDTMVKVGKDIIHSRHGNIWVDLDEYCITNQVYERTLNKIVRYAIAKNSPFSVVNYGEPSMVLSKNGFTAKDVRRCVKMLEFSLFKNKVETIYIVDSTTLRFLKYWDKDTREFKDFDEDVFFNIAI